MSLVTKFKEDDLRTIMRELAPRAFFIVQEGVRIDRTSGLFGLLHPARCISSLPRGSFFNWRYLRITGMLDTYLDSPQVDFFAMF